MEDSTKYPHNQIDAFQHGCNLDLRVRWAFELMCRSPMFEGVVKATSTEKYDEFPQAIAALALNTVDALLRLGEENGLVEPLPDHAELDEACRLHAKRAATFQAVQQIEGNRAAQAEMGSVIPMAPSGRIMNG